MNQTHTYFHPVSHPQVPPHDPLSHDKFELIRWWQRSGWRAPGAVLASGNDRAPPPPPHISKLGFPLSLVGQRGPRPPRIRICARVVVHPPHPPELCPPRDLSAPGWPVGLVGCAPRPVPARRRPRIRIRKGARVPRSPHGRVRNLPP